MMVSNQNFIEKLLDSLDEIAEHKMVSKNELLIREGQVEKNIYYIETGAVRVFRQSELEQQTIRFGYRGSFINSLYSFIKNTPSEFLLRP